LNIFFTVFYRGGDYYFVGTGGLVPDGGGDDGVSTLSLPGVFTCPDIQSSSFQ
jgi:hypothetical protein